MRKENWALRRILAIVLVFTGTTAVHAATVSTLDYFANAIPGTCTAESSTVAGSFYRTYAEPSNQCPGLQVYHQTKGGGLHPWASESFYLSSGWIWQMNEIGYAETSGAITSYRAFRNLTNYWKGMKWLPASFPSTTGSSFSPQPAVEEYWTNSQGVPVCYNTQQTNVPTSVTSSSVVTTYLPQWLQDRRAASLNKNVWHDVDAIVRTDIWATNNRESYWYGRWWNPATAQWQPIGFVRWLYEVKQGGVWVKAAEAQLKYLVDCSSVAECSTCPP